MKFFALALLGVSAITISRPVESSLDQYSEGRDNAFVQMQELADVEKPKWRGKLSEDNFDAKIARW